jgi:hypothetical protein
VPGRFGLSLLSSLVAMYAAAALSVLAMVGIAAGVLAFAAARVVRHRDAQAVLLAAMSVAALIGYGFLERDTDGFRTKFSFLFPAGNPWAFVSASPSAVSRHFSGEWTIHGLPPGGRIFRISVPQQAPAVILRVEGELYEGTLRFSRENESQYARDVVIGPGKFHVEIGTDRKHGDIVIDELSPITRGVVHRMSWLVDPAGAAEAGSPAPSIDARNVAERFSDWRLFGGGIFSSTKAAIFGHSAPLPREQRTSAHNFYIDFAYNFGLLALLPVLALIGYTGVAVWRNRVRILASRQLLALTAVVAFLVLVECNLKVTLRQPYPGIAIYFLWGLLLARLAELDSYPEAASNVG